MRCRKHCLVWKHLGLGYVNQACAHCEHIERSWMDFEQHAVNGERESKVQHAIACRQR